MRIKVLANLGTSEFPDSPFKEGEEHEVSETLGSLLVRRRLADDITPPDPIPVPKQEPAAIAAPATATKPKTSKEK